MIQKYIVTIEDAADTRPILVVPYMWIGDFVRGHSVVRVLNQRWPNRPVDLLTTTLCAPLVDYMPGVRCGHRLGPAAQPAGGGQAMAAGHPAPRAGITARRSSCPAPGNRQ